MIDNNAVSSLLLLGHSESIENVAEVSIDVMNSQFNIPNKHMNNISASIPETLNNKLSKRRSSSGQSVEELRKYFYLPIQSVSKELGICTTILKKLCRNNNIQKWPYRQIKSLTCAIQSLEMAMLNSSVTEVDKMSMQTQISRLQTSIDAIIDDPSILNNEFTTNNFNEESQEASTSVVASSSKKKYIESKQKVKADASNVPRAVNSKGDKSACLRDDDSDDDDDVDDEGRVPDLLEKIQNGTRFNVVPHSSKLGLTVVRETAWREGGRNKTQFIPPVTLPDLSRKRFRSTKNNKVAVPLLEPEICNAFAISLLPRSILKK